MCVGGASFSCIDQKRVMVVLRAMFEILRDCAGRPRAVFFQAEDGIRDLTVTGSSDVCSSDLATSVPDWLRQQGIRALWAPLLVARSSGHVPRSSGALDSIVTLLDVGGFNLVAGDADPEGTDSVHARWEERDGVRRAWSDAVNPLQPTSVAWIPAFDPSDARWASGDSSRGPRGEAVPAPCAFDSTLWAGAFAPAYTALGRLAAEQRTLVIALGLDLRGARGGGGGLRSG